MTTTIDGYKIYYNDGTDQLSALQRNSDGNTASTATNYAVGTYILCDTKGYNGKTNPLPLDGWGRYYSGPNLLAYGIGQPGPANASSWGLYVNGYYLQPAIVDFNSGSSSGIYSGTWVSRGSGLSQAFVVRVA
jgi:hypothetical protein